jgi:hypothetical protein
MSEQKESFTDLNEEISRLKNLLAEKERTYEINLASLKKKVDEKQLQNDLLVNRLEAIYLICSNDKFLGQSFTTETGSSSSKSSSSSFTVESSSTSSAQMSLADSSKENDEEGDDNLKHPSVSSKKSVVTGVSTQNQNTDRRPAIAEAKAEIKSSDSAPKFSSKENKVLGDKKNTKNIVSDTDVGKSTSSSRELDKEESPEIIFRKRKRKAEVEVEVEDLGEDGSAEKTNTVVWNTELVRCFVGAHNHGAIFIIHFMLTYNLFVGVFF